MRADIQTLGQGARNACDAVSLIQVADGALQIIDEKLIRRRSWPSRRRPAPMTPYSA